MFLPLLNNNGNLLETIENMIEPSFKSFQPENLKLQHYFVMRKLIILGTILN